MLKTSSVAESLRSEQHRIKALSVAWPIDDAQMSEEELPMVSVCAAREAR